MKLISHNPSRNYEVLGEVDSSTEQEIQDTVQKAHNAFSLWSVMPLEERCKKITSFVEVSKKRAEEIAQLIAKETGRPITKSREMVQETFTYFESYIRMANTHLSPQITNETTTQIDTIFYEPRGVIACISPWNYPFLDVAWQCGQALLAGNTVVYKHSSENPLFSVLLIELIAESDIPPGVFNVILGDGKTANFLVQQDVNMIMFTGSTSVGQELTKIAAEKFIPTTTELGGSSPCIVFEDMEIDEKLIAFIVTMRFISTGQACDAIKRLIVHESKFDELVKKLIEYVAKQKVGDALEEDTVVGPLISEKQVDLIESQVKDAVEKGAKIEIGGKRPKNLKGAYYLPTLLTNLAKDMRVWKEETFVPVLPVLAFADEAQAIRMANHSEYGLTAHIFTNDKKRFARVAKQIQAGSIGQNTLGFWNPKNPFGGYKKSGMGRTHGEVGFLEVTQMKVVSEEK